MGGVPLLPKDTSTMSTKGLRLSNQELVRLTATGMETTAT